MSIVSIKRRARTGTLEVEHLLKEAAHPSYALANTLDELSAKLQWSFSGVLDNGDLVVPLATWAKVVSTYYREGFFGLIRISDEQDLAGFIIGLLEELKTKEALDTLLLAYKKYLSESGRDIDLSLRIASAVNLMLSFKPTFSPNHVQVVELQAFLCALYTCCEDDAQRAIALLALRGVGDEGSAVFAASKVLMSPWHDVPKIVGRHIRARFRAIPVLNR